MGDAGDDRAARPGALRHPSVGRVLRLAWAAPASLVGLVLSPFFAGRSVSGGVLVCEGATWPRKLGWRYRAITFGHVVLCVDSIDPETMAHERAHVRQYERWGIFLWPAYLVSSLWARIRGRSAYWDNHFERQARAHARTHGAAGGVRHVRHDSRV
jgi:hypothetical protein